MYVSEAAKEDLPKKPTNPYMRYRSDVYDDVKSRNQDKSMTELTVVISQMWTGLDEKKKEKYQKEIEKAKIKYAEDYANWLKKWKLDEKKVKEYFKEEKDKKKKNKRSRKQKDSDDEEAEMMQKAKDRKKANEKSKSPISKKKGKK